VGRFKSPTTSRGLSVVYGVPLNFGCEEIEKKIFDDLDMIQKEFENGESKIFADPLILRKGKDKVGADSWQIPENIFPIDTRGGTSSASIDIFSPAIRYSEYQSKLVDDMKQYEQQVGTDRGFLTPFENGNATTATEIRRANASTIALIDKIHTAIKNGVIMTLQADAVFLNVAGDLYTVKFDFYDAFEDADAQYQRISNAVDRGVAEKSDELQWLFPNLTAEEREEKIARIEAQKQVNTDIALERILSGQ
jgi:A118 family predicted phage portal protein